MKTIQEEYALYKTLVYPKGFKCNDHELQVKRAFYAGMLTIYTRNIELANLGDIEGERLIKADMKELLSVLQGLTRNNATYANN